MIVFTGDDAPMDRERPALVSPAPRGGLSCDLKIVRLGTPIAEDCIMNRSRDQEEDERRHGKHGPHIDGLTSTASATEPVVDMAHVSNARTNQVDGLEWLSTSGTHVQQYGRYQRAGAVRSNPYFDLAPPPILPEAEVKKTS